MARTKQAQARLERISPTFIVDDVIATAEYYRDVLGFHFDNFFGNPPVFVIVSRDDVRINVRQLASRPAGANPNGVTKTGELLWDAFVRVSDADALLAEFRAKNASIVEGPINRAYNMREFVVRDCNGYMLSFGQDLEPSA